MSDGFTEMVRTAQGFFARLGETNTKAFFEAHKALYVDEIRKPCALLADLFAEDLARLTGKPHGPKLFRVHRDVRFSKDKTPYKTHQHMLWSRPGAEGAPAWFFGIAPEGCVMGMGMIGFEKDRLTTWRAMIDREGDALTDEIDAAGAGLGAAIADWGPPPLKRVPQPFGAEHPHADLLVRKSFALRAPLPDGWEDHGLLPAMVTVATGLLPIWRRLDSHFGA